MTSSSLGYSPTLINLGNWVEWYVNFLLKNPRFTMLRDRLIVWLTGFLAFLHSCPQMVKQIRRALNQTSTHLLHFIVRDMNYLHHLLICMIISSQIPHCRIFSMNKKIILWPRVTIFSRDSCSLMEILKQEGKSCLASSSKAYDISIFPML
jgi:hypothetical protein